MLVTIFSHEGNRGGIWFSRLLKKSTISDEENVVAILNTDLSIEMAIGL